MLHGPISEIGQQDDSGAPALKIVLIEERNLLSECLIRCLRERRPQDDIVAYANVIDWISEAGPGDENAIVLLMPNAKRADEPQIATAIESLREACPQNLVIVMAEWEDAPQVLQVLELGARGYIPTSVSLGVAINALLLVAVGGTFIPASSLTSSRNSIQRDMSPPLAMIGAFTARQAAVVEALRKGKANKIIAYELNMRESTVKVHVRNIMKKLRAKNRTEVAFITNSQLSSLV
jgi:DNA-binding NarL/FixJ family response regulator